jgi:hypothetical protein
MGFVDSEIYVAEMVLFGFFLVIHSLAAHGLFEVDQMAVEFGTVNTGEPGPVPHRHPAGSAHAGAINHQRIQADDRL